MNFLFYPGRKKEISASLGFNYVSSLLKNQKIENKKICLEDKMNKFPHYLFVSFHFENQYLLFLKWLAKYFPIERKRRKSFSIIAGGPAISKNPYPLYFVLDYVCIGDAEGVNFKNLEENKNIFIPGKKEGVKVNRYAKFKEIETIPYFIDEKKNLFVEIERGCRYFCNFCLIGRLQKPLRFWDLEKYKEIIIKKKIKKVYLIGSDVFSHPFLNEFLQFLIDRRIPFSIPSSRIDFIEENINILEKGKIRQVAIAPETSEKLRFALNKNLSNEDFENFAKKIRNSKIKCLKLYYILGLPFEKDEDILEIIELSKKIKKLSNKKVKISFSAFSPKPLTPLQFSPFFKIKEYQRKSKLIKKEFKNAFIPNPKHAYIQSLLSIGDEKLGGFILKSYGFGLNLRRWEKLAKKENFDLKSYYKEKNKNFFDFIKINFGISFSKLYGEYKKYKEKVL